MPPRNPPAAPRSQSYQQEEYFEDSQYARAPVETADSGFDYEDPHYARGTHNAQYYEEDSYDSTHGAQYEAEYAEDDYQPEYADEGYDDAPRRKSRWLLAGVMASIGVVVLGVASLYGYRVLFGRHHTGTPPTIRSGDAPNKVVPSASQASKEVTGQKQIYDRVGSQPGTERVVSREEQPADLAADHKSTRVVTQPVEGSAGPRSGGSVSAFAAPPAQAAHASVLNPPSPRINHAAGEPRRVHTVTVRADGTVVPNTRHSVSTRPVAAPLALNPNAHAEARDVATRQPPPTPERAPAAVRSVVPAQTQTPNNSPWAGVRQPAPAPRAQQVSNYVPAGSYVVQVSSQKSEADAQASWQKLQAKYTNVLGNQQVSFKRVDLGDRGTFYRAMVGPFASRDQAYEMCQKLKTAGGECVVQRN